MKQLPSPWPWLVRAALALALGVQLLMMLLEPFARDQGIFAWAAMAVLQGGLPYAEAWDVKGPAASLTYALAFGLFGKHEWAIRLIDIALTAAGLIATWRLLKPRLGAMYTEMILLLMVVLQGFWAWDYSQPDVWAAWLGVLVLVHFLNPQRLPQARDYILSGLAIGWMVCLKPTFAGMALPLLWFAWREKRLVAALLGLSALPLAVGAVFIYRGEVGKLWEVLVVYNITGHRLVAQNDTSLLTAFVRLWHRPELLKEALTAVSAFFVLGERLVHGLVFISTVYFCLKAPKESRPQAIFGLMVMGAMGLNVLAQAKFFLYHMPSFYFVEFVVFGWVVPPGEAARRWKLALLVALVLFRATLPLMGSVHILSDYVRQPYLAAAQPSGETCVRSDGFCYPHTRDAAAFIRSTTAPQDRVYLWGFDALLYFVSDRLPPTRLGFYYPMVTGPEAYRAAVRQELLTSLKANPPVLLVVEKNDANTLVKQSSDELLESFLPLKDFIARFYMPVFENDSYRIYRKQP